MELFRPPFGEYDNHVIETAEQNGYYTIQWDVDTPTTKRKAVRILEKSRFVTTFFYVKADGKPILREINSANERACKLPLSLIHIWDEKRLCLYALEPPQKYARIAEQQFHAKGGR